MAGQVRKAGQVGIISARSTDPTGDNPVANFTRGFYMYHADQDLRAQRKVALEANNAALKKWALSNKS